MNFDLPELHLSIAQAVRQMVRTQIAGRAHALEGGIDAACASAIDELDLGQLLVPEDAGGLGLDALALSLVVEALAEASPSVAWALAVHAGPAARGLMGAGVAVPSFTERASYGAFAPRANTHWVLDGGVYELGALDVRDVDPMGLRGAGMARVTATGEPVATLDEAARADAQRLERLMRATLLLGCASGATAAALAYAAEREQFGRPIGKFQAIQWKLADAAMHTESARWMVRRAAVSGSADDAARALRFAARLTEVASEALQVHGGYGYTVEFPVERLLRGARMLAQPDDARRAIAEALTP